MRIDTHEIDTQARRLVPLTFPRQWEHRELTGRDYGVDMEIELFFGKNPSGQILILQIKGTEKEISFVNDLTYFDIPTKTLIYSEHFVTPFLLVICPVNNDKPTFYYLWLQDYINTVLNIENPNWRLNKFNIRIFIPKDNKMPGNEQHLAFISHFPQRLYGVCEVSRILHNLMYKLDGEPRPTDYLEVFKELRKITSISGFLSDQWKRGEFIHTQYLQPAILAAELIYSNRQPSTDDYKRLPLIANKVSIETPGFIEKKDFIFFQLQSQVAHSLNCMSTFFEETNYGLKNILWNEEHDQDF
jgi:hypothetical protein